MERQVLRFQVEPTAPPLHSAHGSGRPPGVISPHLEWDIEYHGEAASENASSSAREPEPQDA